MRNSRKKIAAFSAGIFGVYIFLRAAAKRRAEGRDVDADNPYIHTACQEKEQKEYLRKAQKVCQSLEQEEGCRQEEQSRRHVYECRIKPAIDRLLSFCGLLLLSPVFVLISAAIVIDDPGPVLFTQKRVGKNKQFFMLHKFRSMKRKTPHDVPTHQLSDPEQYITRVGKFLRKYSLDELPQIWDIFRGRMSIIGPRPALWNQADLVAERDRYGANDILPGLTGWAQINGRDELEIGDKARLDGEYVKELRQGGIKALFFDLKCFWRTVASVLESEGVVEGGTGELKKAMPENIGEQKGQRAGRLPGKRRREKTKGRKGDGSSLSAEDAVFEDYGHLKYFDIDLSEKK